MGNGGPVVGLDAPTAKFKMVKLDNRDGGLESGNLRFARNQLEVGKWQANTD